MHQARVRLDYYSYYYYGRKLARIPLISADFLLGDGRFSRPQLVTGLKNANIKLLGMGECPNFCPKPWEIRNSGNPSCHFNKSLIGKVS